MNRIAAFEWDEHQTTRLRANRRFAPVTRPEPRELSIEQRSYDEQQLTGPPPKEMPMWLLAVWLGFVVAFVACSMMAVMVKQWME